MKRKEISPFLETAVLNNITFIQFYEMLKLLAINSLKWENLPLTINERFLNLTLFNKGSILFFKDEIIGYIVTDYTSDSTLNIYGEPLKMLGFAENGYQKQCTNDDSVIIYDNYLRISYAAYLKNYALRLYEVQRAIDVNVKTQKFPFIILCPENNKLSMKNLMLEYEGNTPFIYGNNKLPIDGINTINLNSPYVADKLQILKNQIWNEALTFLGIENSNQDKKERLVSSEVGSNYGSVEMYRNVRLKSIRDSIKMINEKFGLNIKVKFNSEVMTMINMGNLNE